MKHLLLVGTLTLTACGLGTTVKEAATTPTPPQRVTCYEVAEHAARVRAYEECPSDWLTCPARPSILAELRRAMAECP